MDTDGVIQLISITILVLFSAFFSSAETAFTTVNRVRLRAMAEEGSKAARTALKILDNYRKMLSVILIGNNIVNIAASALATSFAIRIWGNPAIGIATGILTLVILIGGEILPKTLANLYSEKIVLSYGASVLLFMRLLTPVVFLIDKMSYLILWLLHIDPNYKAAMTETELKTYVDVSHEDGVIETEEREMIYNVFDFGDTQARDVMIPRINMTSISIGADYDEALAVFRESMYTRLPVYEEDKDNIVGLINIKDFILVEGRESFKMEDIMREGYYTYELKKTTDLMMEMRDDAINIAFVLNEYGATVGMITLEDLLEEIVGEIRDEYDEDEEEFIRQTGDNTYLVEAGMKLDDINDALGTELDSEDYDSIGGLMIECLERLPEDEEAITTEEGIILQAKGISQNRINKILLTLPEDEDKIQENGGKEGREDKDDKDDKDEKTLSIQKEI